MRERGAVADERFHDVEPLVDALCVGERPGDEAAQRTRAHGRFRHVENAEERGLPRHVAARQKLQMDERTPVEDERVALVAHREGADVREVVVERRAHIVEERTRRRNEVVAAAQAEAVEREDAEVARQRLERRLERERPAVLVRLLKTLGGADPRQRLVEFLPRVELLQHELARREVEEREREVEDGGDKRVRRLVEKPVLRHRAGRDDARHLAADETLRRLGILHLVAERGRLAGADEFREVGVDGVVGDAAHRLAVALGERRAEDGRGQDRVVAEHLVEVAEAEHDDRARRHLAPDGEILAHHRGEFALHAPVPFPRTALRIAGATASCKSPNDVATMTMPQKTRFSPAPVANAPTFAAT